MTSKQDDGPELEARDVVSTIPKDSPGREQEIAEGRGSIEWLSKELNRIFFGPKRNTVG